MKIGIITYWQSNDNYGQILQCYALQSFLRNNGHDAFLIRYTFIGRKIVKPLWKKIARTFLIYPIIRDIKSKQNDKKKQSQLKELLEKNKIRRFDEFKKNNIVVSDFEYNNLCSLNNNPPCADLYITGSDQVWSQLLSLKENEVFYLNFGDKRTKRISYAASFGMDYYPTNLQSLLYSNLKRFDNISVREQTGVDICRNVGFSAIKVVDPTMLLDKEAYKKICSSQKFFNYYYIYSLNITNKEDIYFEDLKTIAKDNKNNIIVTTGSGCVPAYELFNDVEYDYSTIPEWLSNINFADLVVTTSFHGVVFSLILNTPFVYIPLKGNLQKMNNRALDLLISLGLADRIKSEEKNYDEIISSTIDWNLVNNRLSNMTMASKKYLYNNLK